MQVTSEVQNNMEELKTAYALEAKEIVELLTQYYLAKPSVPVFIVGDRGIGKSQAVRDAAENIAKVLGRTFVEYDDRVADKILEEPEEYFVLVDFRLTETEPSDLIGIPRPENGHVVYKPLKWAVVLSKVPGILFLDELNMVQRPDVESAMFKILNEGKVGFVKLLGYHDKESLIQVPEKNRDLSVLIVAAGNDPKVNPLAKYLTVPAMGRLMKINARVPQVENWIEWMNSKFGDDWDKAIGAFLYKYRNFFHWTPRTSRTLDVYPEPRKWTKLALVSHKLPDKYVEIVARGLVGIEAAEHFLVFKSMNIPDESVVLKDPKVYSSLKMDAQRLLLTQIAMNFDVDNLEKYLKFAQYLHENDREGLLMLMLLMDKKKLKAWLKKGLSDKKWSFVLKFAIEAEQISVDIEKLQG